MQNCPVLAFTFYHQVLGYSKNHYTSGTFVNLEATWSNLSMDSKQQQFTKEK